jgi:hypothetical protein
MSQSASVKAVGFAFFSPGSFILFANHTRDQVQLFPPRTASEQLRFANDDRRHVVVLRALDKVKALEPHADKIDLLVVFADSNDLLSLGLPIMDGEKDDEGNIVGKGRQNRSDLLERIEAEAVDFPLDKSASATQHILRKAKEAAAYDGPTFREQLRSIREAVNNTEKFDFTQEAGVPSVLRLMGDTSREDFKSACRGIITRGNVPENRVKSFFRWIEGIDGGIGPELGKAVDAFLYPDDEDAKQTAEEVANRYGVDVKDVKLIANTYSQLQDDSSEEE